MWKSDVLDYFGGVSVEVARALGVTKQAISRWNDLVPELAARRLYEITDGGLDFDESLYREAG